MFPHDGWMGKWAQEGSVGQRSQKPGYLEIGSYKSFPARISGSSRKPASMGRMLISPSLRRRRQGHLPDPRQPEKGSPGRKPRDQPFLRRLLRRHLPDRRCHTRHAQRDRGGKKNRPRCPARIEHLITGGCVSNPEILPLSSNKNKCREGNTYGIPNLSVVLDLCQERLEPRRADKIFHAWNIKIAHI